MPFLDKAFLDVTMGLDPELKMVQSPFPALKKSDIEDLHRRSSHDVLSKKLVAMQSSDACKTESKEIRLGRAKSCFPVS